MVTPPVEQLSAPEDGQVPRTPPLPIVRYWTPIGHQSDGFGGFDLDEDRFRRAVRPGTEPLAELSGVPCLFLLGEPALGKSTAIRQEEDRLRTTLPSDERVLRCNLTGISSDSALDGLFEDPLIQDWRGNGTTLHLFLDSFDECLRRYPALKPRLLERLGELPLGRLRLRVACRSGDFPGHLPEEVNGLWSAQVPETENPVSVLRLEPLSSAAIRTWAVARGVNVEDFLRAVSRHNAWLFARRPVTLNGLLSRFGRGAFPNTEVELYAASCQELCAEQNPDRVDEPRLAVEQRLAIAERVAALSTLAGKDLLWLGSPSEVPDGALSIDELVGGDEEVDGTRVTADRRAVEDVVEGCALFEVHDARLVRWSQQSYREFLAASYFARRMRDGAKVAQFLEHQGRPGSSQRFVAPQLAESAAWLAGMDDVFARWVIEHDPAVLLRASHHVRPSIREGLVAWWLEEESSGRPIDARWWPERLQAEFDHPTLAAQLERILDIHSAHERGRSLACHFAGACRCSALEPSLLAIALDDGAHLHLRWSAVAALGEVGSDEAKARLLPLLAAIADDSGDAHRLRGQVLATVWPAHLSTTEALDVLAAHQVAAGDEYSTTFSAHFLGLLAPDHLVEALNWIAARTARPDDPLDQLVAEILTSAAERIEDDEVRIALARAIVTQLRAHHVVLIEGEARVLEELLQRPESTRLRLADELVALLQPSDDAVWGLARLLVSLHLPYSEVVSRVGTTDPVSGTFWVRVLRADVRIMADIGALKDAWSAMPDGTDPKIRLGALIDQVASWIAERERPVPAGEGRAPDPSPRLTRQEVIERDLALVDLNFPQAWYNLCRDLNLDEERSSWILEHDLSQTPGWVEASADQRRRVLRVALQFLQEVPRAWPGERLEDWAMTSGYQAAALLADEAPGELEGLAAAMWRFWLPGLVATRQGGSDRSRLQRLIAMAYHRFPTEIRQEVSDLLPAHADLLFTGSLPTAFELCWDPSLADILVGSLAEDDLPTPVQVTILSSLLRHGDARGAELALAWVRRAAEERERAEVGARCVLLDGGEADVTCLVEALTAQPDLARNALLAIAPFEGAGKFPSQSLPERVLADLYLLAADLFPPRDDQERRAGVVREVGAREMAASLRDRLVRRLADLGTWDALEELERIIRMQPDLALPLDVWDYAVQAALRRAWVPFARPSEVLTVVSDERRRVLRSADQLLDLVLESLGRLQEDLVAHDAVADVWSEWTIDGRTRYRPKQELSLSHYVKRFLDRDLAQYAIVANREVENRPGNETDILVQYLDPADRSQDVRRLAIVIEVKGCWNDGVLTDIRSQLADRYLAKYETDRGIYLVGWFGCAKWDVEHGARVRCVRHTLTSLQEVLTAQARDLTDERRRVEAVVLDASLR